MCSCLFNLATKYSNMWLLPPTVQDWVMGQFLPHLFLITLCEAVHAWNIMKQATMLLIRCIFRASPSCDVPVCFFNPFSTYVKTFAQKPVGFSNRNRNLKITLNWKTIFQPFYKLIVTTHCSSTSLPQYSSHPACICLVFGGTILIAISSSINENPKSFKIKILWQGCYSRW